MLFMSRSSKYRKIGPYGLGAVLLITMVVMLRLILIGNGWPLTNSDEAINAGLPALHILHRGELPIFAYGQNYMGAVEAYLGACFFPLFGPSTFAIRLGLVIMYAAFLLALYLLACLLYPKGVALAALFFLCWGSSDTLFEQLTATGGRLETPLFGTLSLLLASWLALSFHPDRSSREQPPEGARRKRLVAYGCLGGVIGLGIWSHMLVLPFVCTSLLLLLLFCRRELRTQASLFGVLGFLIGAFPLLLFNIEHLQNNSLLTLWQQYRAGGTPLPTGENLGTYILGAILITIPTATGANPLCPISEPNPWLHPLSLSCIGFQACWGLGIVIVWALAVFVVIKELRKLRQVLSTSGSLAEKEHLVRCTCRLMVLASAGLTALSYATSPTAALYPDTSARYLVGLSVTTPAIVAFLWPRLRLSLSKVTLTHLATGWTPEKIANSLKIGILCFFSMICIFGIVTVLRQIAEEILPVTSRYYLLGLLVATPAIVASLRLRRTRGRSALSRLIVKGYSYIIKIGLFCFISLVLIHGTITTFQSIPDAQKGIQRQNTLIHSLLRRQALHIYSDYWTCNRLIFLSDERIICSVLNPDLSPGNNRYEPYMQIVKQNPHPAYVFDIEEDTTSSFNILHYDQASIDGIPMNQAFRRRFGAQYHPVYLAGFVIYLPANETPT